MKYLCALCEGKSELRFCQEVLLPYLLERSICVLPQLLVTSKKYNAKGGIINYAQVRRDLMLMMRTHHETVENSYYFTTMLDLYALPNDFPEYEIAQQKQDYEQVAFLESAFGEDISSHRFIPYIQLHEFEALTLCNIAKLIENYPAAQTELEILEQEINTTYTGNTELVNNSPQTAPSKRIIAALEGKYHFDKPKSGVDTTKAVGVDRLKERCSHFDDWINRIIQM